MRRDEHVQVMFVTSREPYSVVVLRELRNYCWSFISFLFVLFPPSNLWERYCWNGCALALHLIWAPRGTLRNESPSEFSKRSFISYSKIEYNLNRKAKLLLQDKELVLWTAKWSLIQASCIFQLKLEVHSGGFQRSTCSDGEKRPSVPLEADLLSPISGSKFVQPATTFGDFFQA